MSLTGLAFVAAFAGAMGLALFRHPLYGLYAYVAVFYLHPPSRWWGQDLPDMRWALLAAAVTFIATLRLPADNARASWISTTPAKLLLAYTLWLWLQNLWALDAAEQIDVSILFTKYLVLFYLIYRLIDTPKKITWFLVAHVAGCAYLGWLAYDTTVSGRLDGVGGPGIDEANALAMQMGTAVAIAAMLMLGNRGWVKWLCFLAMPFLLNTMVLAGSRSAFLALMVCGLVLWYLKPQKYRRMFYVFAALGLVLFLWLANEMYWNRVNTITAVTQENAEADGSTLSRLALIQAQWAMAKEHPLGAGYRGTAVLSPQYLDPIYLSRSRVNGKTMIGQRSSHNTFMGALVEQGIPGAIMFAWLWLWTIQALRRSKERGADPESTERAVVLAAVGGALAVVFVAGQFVDYLKVEVQIWMFVILAVLLQLQRIAVAKNSSSPVNGMVPVSRPGVAPSSSASVQLRDHAR